MKKDPIISISVPVYNAEKYLRQCLDSLVGQTLRDIEIVVVNDGSTDSSESIIREYAEQDSRIVLICKENGGLASARQAALEVSTGRYFCACDADDWVETDIYEKLYEKAVESDADIVMCDYWSEYPNGKAVARKYPYQLDKREDLLDDALNKFFPTMVWNKMFKRELFNRNDLSWELGINMGEDLLMMLKILKYPVKIAYQPLPLYHYRRIVGGTSYTNDLSITSFNQLLWIRKWIAENIDVVKYNNGIFVQWLDQAYTGLRVKEGMNNRIYKETTLDNLNYIGFLNYSYPRFKGFIILISKIFGYKIGKAFVSFIYKYFYH